MHARTTANAAAAAARMPGSLLRALSAVNRGLLLRPARPSATHAGVRRSPLLPIFLIVVVDVLGLTIILPLLPFYAEKLGASPAQVGALVSTYAVCQLVAGPMLGRLSDHMGRKPLLLVSQVGTCIGFLVLARAEVLWVVFLSRAIDGITAGNLSLAQAYIADVTEPQNRAKAFGVIGIAFGIGFLFGPALSGFMSQFGYHYPIYLAAGLSALSILATATLLPSSKPHAEGTEGPAGPGGRRLSVLDWKTYADYFRKPDLSAFLWQFFLFTFAFAIFTSGFALYAERRITWNGHVFGAREVGYTFAYSGFLGIILQGGLIGRLVKRFGELPLISFGWISMALGYVLLAAATNVPILVAAATVSAMGHGILRPTLTSQITQRVSRGEQGVVLGLNQSLQSISQIAAPIASGFLIQHDQLVAWAMLAAVVSFGALVLERRAAGRAAAA
jgi:MFS family permease